MERFIPRSFRQLLALVMCVAMLLPMIPVPVYAEELTELSEETSSGVVTEDSAEAPVTNEAAPQAEDSTVIAIADGISIPAYTGGKTSKTLAYDCGNGVAKDGSKSYLTIVTGTTSKEFVTYTQLLAAGGYKLKTEKLVEIESDDENDPNRFASFTSPDGTYKLYTYHFPFYQETRIIVDTQEDTVKGFHYEAGEIVTTPMMVMYGLSMATNGYDGQYSTSIYKEQRRNCGALVVIRMPDNSLFIHDGGDIQQWSDDACDEFLAFCRKLTGTTGTDEKMVINTWFLSHAHSDHFLGFPRFINKYHDHFEMKNIMYNIDDGRTDSTRDIEPCMNLVSSHFDGVKYYKPHTGESFTIAGVEFDVMYALEDRYVPTEDGTLSTDTDDLGGTYRGYFYDTANDTNSPSDFNDTNTVLRVTFENGVNSILYADMNRGENTLFDIYPAEALKGDIVMVPHHGFDEHAELMAMSDATIFLYTQHKQAIYGPDGDYTTNDGAAVVRARLRNNFVPLMDALNATGRVEGKDYKFYWAGCETAAIDINSMGSGTEAGTALPGMALDTAAAEKMDITVYTSEPNTDLYTNPWTIYDLNDGTATVSTSDENLIEAIDNGTTVEGKETTTNYVRFLPVTGAPTVGTAYLIRSSAYPKYVMSYSAVAETPGTVNAATSLIQDKNNPITSTATDLFFDNGTNVYLDHSNRDNVLWIFEQNNLADGEPFEPHSTNYFEGTRYRRVRLVKGTNANAAYWYAVDGNDATDPITQYRFMNPRYIAQWIRNTAIADDTYRNYYALEEITTGVYLIYYRANETDYRVLTCDSEGNWKTVRYDDEEGDYPYAQLEEDVKANKLQVKLYSYQLQEDYTKKIDFSGSSVFNVEQGTTTEQIFNYIQQNIVVRDNARRNLAIPGSGDTAKVGYYWLDFNKTFDSSKAGTYTVTVKYRNDDGTDTTITTLTVNVAGIKVTGTTIYTVMEGTSPSTVEAMIKEALTVTQTAGGTTLATLSYTSTPTEGAYYWLDFNVPFDSSASGTDIYTVSVKYRNPDGTDAVSDTKLTVIVKPLDLQLEGAKAYVVQEGVTEADVRTQINDSITVTKNTLTNERAAVSYAATPTVGSYWLDFDSAFDSSASGDHDYFVSVKYRNADGTDTLIETLVVYVEQEITSYAAPNHMVGTVPLNAGLTTVAQHVEGETSSNITFTVNGKDRFVTVGLLTKDGNRVDTSKAGTYTGLTLTYMDQVICDKTFTLIVTDSNEALNYPQQGQGGYVGVDKQSTTTTDEFKETGVANIQLSATGTAPEKGVDLIFIMDLSGSMLNEIGTNVDAEDYQNSRAVAMKNALKNMIQTLAESGQDVTIAMSDFGDVDHYRFDGAAVDESIIHESSIDINNDNGRYLSSSNENKDFEFTNHLNYVFRSGEATALDANGRAISKIGTFANVHTKFNMAHPLYTGVIPPMVYTGSGETDAKAFVDISELYAGSAFTSDMEDILAKIDENVHKSLGTNYDIGLEYAYHLAYAKQQENIANGVGEEREVVCIFMSDGAAMQYNYFSGRPDSQSWSDYLKGSFDSIGATGITEENLPGELEEISARMLKALQDGKLNRPEYHRDTSSPQLYADVNGAEVISHTESEYFLYRMRSDKGRDPGTTNFYTYMEDLGFDLDWEYLCSIAKANGIEDFDFEYYQSNPLMTELTNKLLTKDTLLGYELVGDNYYAVYQTDLVNPGLDETQYYPQFTGTAAGSNSTEQFMNAMAAIGVDCTWDLYGKIAFKNRNMDISGAANTYEIEHALKAIVAAMKTVGNGEAVSYSPYPYFYNAEGKNWWAEAIKGDTDKIYPVINKYAKDGEVGSFHKYNGDVPNKFSGETTTGLALDGQEYISGFRGLGMDMYTISFSICADQLLTPDVADQVLKNVSSGASYFYAANTEEGLTDALKSIVGSMSTAATRAWFTDTMGEAYDLYIGQPNTTFAQGEVISDIHVYEYELDANGDRKDNPIVRETITITDLDGDGDVDAWSNQMYNTVTDKDGKVTLEYYDIWDETTNVITGKYVIYNANTSGTTQVPFGTQGSYPLPAETFFWTIGVIGETEMVLDYPVYLTGSMEGELNEIPAGQVAVYDTNKKADLHYINYLGNNCEQPTVPPAFPWGNPAVGYVFYLVDEQGNPLDSQGRTTNFTNSLKLTTAVYENLNTGDGNNVTTIAASAKLPTELGDLYELYYPSASYSVVYDESWQNNGGTTTYVTNYGGAAYSNAANSTVAEMNGKKLDLEKTVVYFALKFKAKAKPDTVVIDFGLPVKIDVLGNDLFASSDANVLGIKDGDTVPSNGMTTVVPGYLSKDDGDFGTLELLTQGADKNLLKYRVGSMEMPAEEVFTYAAREESSGRHYYSTVTVIPATTIYYEDDFVTYKVYDYVSDEDVTNVDVTISGNEKYANNKWSVDGNTVSAVQGQDRPGEYNRPEVDANNIYGYDGAYTSMAAHSMDSAMKVTVDADVYAEATFTFWGTGFDVVSLTSSDSGTILVDVYDAEDFATSGYDATPVEYHLVDTYYGYKWDGENWVADQTASDCLYQVPVMKINGLNYDQYTVVISASYQSGLDHNTEDASYDFYLDAIRIYDPANDGQNNTTIENAYETDHEGWPEYFELRNLIIAKKDFDSLENGTGSGIVFIDNTLDAENNISYSISDYTNFGPNNELYLAPGQSIAFQLNVTDTKLDQIHLAMKSVGNAAKASVYDAADSAKKSVTPTTIATATDLYYDITALNGKTVVIQNTDTSGNAILSITNVKVTYTAEHTDSLDNSFFTTSRAVAKTALMSLRPAVPEEPDVPVEPEVFEPEKFNVRVSDSSVKVGSKVTVTVTTGADVGYITVNGTKVTKYTGSWFSSSRTWLARVEAEKVGQMDVAVVCYNSDDLASESVVETITVTQQYTSLTNVVKDLISGIFGRFWGSK